MYKFVWILPYLFFISLIINDHNSAPDHYVYNNYFGCEELFIEFSNENYEKYWSFIVNKTHKCLLDNADNTIFYFGIFLFLISVYLLGRKIEIKNRIIFYPCALFSYTGIISSTIDKTSLIFFLFTIIYLEISYDNSKLRKVMLILLGLVLILFLRGWLVPFAFFIILLSTLDLKNKILLLKFQVVFILFSLFLLSYFLEFNIILKYFLILPFIFFDPLPKDYDKFIFGGLFEFLLIAHFFRISFYIYYFIYFEKYYQRFLTTLCLVFALALSTLIHALYFEFQDFNFGLTSDAVRKTAFFWPILLSILLTTKNVK